MTKHTPGPFTVIVDPSACFHKGNRVAIVSRGELLDDETGEHAQPTVAEVWSTDDDTDIADGHLFSAAPEMATLFQHVLNSEADTLLDGGCVLSDSIRDEIRALLRKAGILEQA